MKCYEQRLRSINKQVSVYKTLVWWGCVKNKVLCSVYDVRVLQGFVAYKKEHYDVCEVKVLEVCFKYKEEQYDIYVWEC